MKIAQVCPYDFAYPGGVVSHIIALERYLTQMGHQIKVIAPASKTVSALGDRFIAMGKPLPVPTSGSIARISLSLRLAPRIKELLAREEFDIIHLHEPFRPMLCLSVLRLSNTVNIGTFHAAEGEPGYHLGWPFGLIWVRRLARKLHGNIACAQASLEYAARFIPRSYEMIPDGIDLEKFSPNVAPIDRFYDGKLNILFVGRLEHRKGLDYMIEAYQKVKLEHPETRLLVVSPDLGRSRKYRRRVDRNGIEDVFFINNVSDDELPRYYRTADIFCSPATGHESFGIVLLEAMAMGKPVVASNISGYADWITHGSDGLLVLPKDVGALAQALVSLCDDESLRNRIGSNGLITAKKYSCKETAWRIAACYQKLLDEKSLQSSGNT